MKKMDKKNKTELLNEEINSIVKKLEDNEIIVKIS